PISTYTSPERFKQTTLAVQLSDIAPIPSIPASSPLNSVVTSISYSRTRPE
ncbi:hypothetical protein M405DRAFT_804095, partial [Rhizopogon salebrosus TDB-379]